MKTSKKYLVGFILIFGTVNYSVSQEKVEIKEVEKRTMKDKKELKKKDPLSTIQLEDAQKMEVKMIRADYRVKLEAVKKDSLLLEEDKRSTYQQLRKEQSAEIRSVLTEDQKKELKQQRMQRKPNLDYKRPSADELATRYVERIDEVVTLNESQKAELTSIYKEHFAKRQEIWKNSNLSEENKKAEFQKIKEAKKEKERKVLTEQQVKELEKHKAEKKESRNKK